MDDWFKGKFIGKPHIEWENLWFPVDFPLNQSIDIVSSETGGNGKCPGSGDPNLLLDLWNLSRVRRHVPLEVEPGRWRCSLALNLC